jgi:hypothetical protein
MTVKPSVGDAILTNITNACKTQASKEIKNELRRGKAAIKRVANLERANRELHIKLTKLKKEESNALKAKDKEMQIERAAIVKKERAVIKAAKKVRRGLKAMDRLRKLTVAQVMTGYNTTACGYYSRNHNKYITERTALKEVSRLAQMKVIE